MNCEQMMELMQRFVDEDLTQTEEQSLMDHISQCPDCAASFEQLQRLSAELSLLPMVSPPYNIVDSILPKLAELDAQQAAIRVAYLSSASRSNKAIFSWKAAAGFVAAAAIFSLVAVNLTPSSKQDASEMKVGKVTASKAMNPEAPMAKSDAASASGVSNYTMSKSGTVQTDKSEVKPEAAAKTNETMDKLTSSTTPSATTDNTKDLKVKFSQSVNATKSVSPQPSQTPTPAPQPAASPGLYMETQANQSLASDDGNFIGLVERQIVQVHTPDGNRIYTSSIQWKSTDTIHLSLWQDNKYLTYEVKMEDGQVKRFVIDPILKTEQEQKN